MLWQERFSAEVTGNRGIRRTQKMYELVQVGGYPCKDLRHKFLMAQESRLKNQRFFNFLFKQYRKQACDMHED